MSVVTEPQLLTATLRALQDLRHLPGYAGFKPQHKWRYGDTFGNDTAKYFQERRIVQLNKSTAQEPGMEWDGKMAFPTVYSNDPKLVVGARTRERDRWLDRPQYALFNHHDRDVQIRSFDKLAQDHRRYFLNKSGTVPRVEYFVKPKKGNVLPPIKQPKENDGSGAVSDQQEVTIKCPLCGRKAPPKTKNIRAYIQAHHPTPQHQSPPKSTWRDRQIRDFYFERR